MGTASGTALGTAGPVSGRTNAIGSPYTIGPRLAIKANGTSITCGSHHVPIDEGVLGRYEFAQQEVESDRQR